ncbi:hypothetical protein LTS07_008244 [Exophiala sideris]|uniref:Xylanolytic transcriptional activator regulatory domain-containing protein n=1 Tax=Exophiala sideris TaxID=1016849 RepID=A0ABR0JHH5_9EURO|nr:hypothetical protein LTS07_008244 [Exophiala sideris]KAK5032968.1 hypothetical protein LTR13_006933 [Exophiala sideris]KAK5063453.1 hypothetical protein LTR69_004159 [Exophiala sideris]KAK5180715.1 hypothetical protein LTR44_007029 [Eurotiomycetes sp. CCFEE 6388]
MSIDGRLSPLTVSDHGRNPESKCFSESDTLAKTLKTLPSCQRCKKGRRSYVKSLITSLKKLKQQKSTLAASQAIPTARSPTTSAPREHVVSSDDTTPKAPGNTQNNSDLVQNALYSRPPSTPSSMHDGSHFPVATPQGPDVRYYGGSSVFSLAVATLARARSDPRYSFGPLQESEKLQLAPPEFHGGCNCVITKDMVEKSVDLYMVSLHPIYPFLNASDLSTDLQGYWEVQSSGIDPATLRDKIAHQYFRIKIIAGIASASRSRYNASRIACDHGCYLEAVKCVAEVTSEISTNSLRALMLLIVYCLFRPRKGDIWKLLDYACRLCLELGYHNEPDPSISMAESEQQRNTFWSLYVIESMVGQLLGRPSDLPEGVITVKWPLSATISTHDSSPDDLALRWRQAGHQYRLVHLRSGMFAEMYLNDKENIRHDLAWYQERLKNILDWYLQSRDDTQNLAVGSLTCNISFHSTILFLFQPLVVEALRTTRAESPNIGASDSLPSPPTLPVEIYTSACKLIEIYEQIITSPRNSEYGIYPVTFMSAHNIFMASIMIMAYCILRLDGSVSFTRLIGTAWPAYEDETAHIQVDNVLQVSNSCLILLTFCAEKWPGMSGMREIYRQLSDQVLKSMFRLRPD